MFNFDQTPDRRHSDSMKWQRYAGRDVLPMWVADMDFPAPQAVLDALHKRIDHGVLGYAKPWRSLIDAIVQGIEHDHAWSINPDWIVWLPGVVPGLNLASQCVGEQGDNVLTVTPVYPPFLSSAAYAQKRLIRSDMILNNGRWECDWDDLRAHIDTKTCQLLLCNPHNPVGRVYSREELLAFSQLAQEHNLTICSDEIHCGLVIDPHKTHIPIASLNEDTAQRTITLMAPSKTWNIPGLGSAFAIIPDATLRSRYQRAMRGLVSDTNLLGLVATEAAYRHGHAWRMALLEYLRDNAKVVFDRIQTIPGISTTSIEATYLAWIDCRALKLDNPCAHFEQYGLGVSNGRDFGSPGFIRLNFGCSGQMLSEGLQRLEKGVHAANSL